MSEQSSDSAPASDGLRPVVELKGILADLPRLGFVRRAAANRDESKRDDIIFNVQSIDDLVLAARRHFGIGKPTVT
jgi:hypothetical protein